MPRVDWKVRLLAEIFHPSQLVVYERLERGHVDQIESALSLGVASTEEISGRNAASVLPPAVGAAMIKSLSPSRRVNIAALLNVVQLSPTPVPDPASDGLGEPVKCGGWGCARA